MPLKDYQFSFTPVMPQLRSSTEIAVDLNPTGAATDAARAMVAQVEFHVAQGDSLYAQARYSGALDEFKAARALVYGVLYPEFDSTAFVRWKGGTLPVSAAIETALLNASVRIADIIRPTGAPAVPLIARQLQAALPAALAPLAATGYRETLGIEERMQNASTQAVALIRDLKPDAAVSLLEDTLARASLPNVRVDPSLKAALQLNLAVAYLEAANPQSAATHANAAAELFKGSSDVIGQSQATHLAGVSAVKSGNAAQAQQLFQAAAALLKRASPAPGLVPSPPTVSRPGPVVIDRQGPRPILRPGTRTLDVSSSVSIVEVPITRDVSALDPIAKMSAQSVTFRIAGRADGWGAIALQSDVDRRAQSKAWQVGIPVGRKLATVSLGAGALPPVSDLIAKIYRPRIAETEVRDLTFPIIDTSTTTFYLTHLYAYVLPIKTGDALHKLGQYAAAENAYVQAASYSFLNKNAEATALWLRIAQNTLDWGDSLYKSESFADAKVQYAKIVTDAGGVPSSLLYSTSSLAVPAQGAKDLIQALVTRPIPDTFGETSIPILSAFARLQQLASNLDFYGLLLSPIHTFEFLQGVARGFAQEASQAEQQFANFKSRQEAEESTRRDLEMAQAMSHADADAKAQQVQAARADAAAADAALALAQKRAADAKWQRDAYKSVSSAQIWAQAAAQALSGGEDAMYSEISELADRLARGETISGPGPKLAAAQTLKAGRRTQAYELQKMQDNIDELTKAIPIAAAQVTATHARANATEIEWQAALKRASLADAALEAFDNDFFTPETWSRMSDIMRNIAASYLYRGIRIAKLMERAYNFENDASLNVIKNDYGFAVAAAAPGRDTIMLGGDSLLVDIESFTFEAITSKTRKSSRIKDVVSIANDFPAHFEDFRRTGLLAVETDLYEFDRRHPGFYSQRLEAIEVELIGVLPDDNAPSGTVTAGGVTSFRRQDGTVGQRVHEIDTMALSDFTLRGDAFLYTIPTGVRGLFQGYGIGATWQLHLPKRSNDFDFRRIFDVNLILYYTAMFDEGLRATMLALPPRPGELELLRTFSLRADFPDAWYGFYRGGSVSLAFDRARLPFNQQNFSVKSAQFRVVTKAGVANVNLSVRITSPDGFAGTATTDVNGMVSSADPPLAGLAGGGPVGGWKVEVLGGVPLEEGGTLRFDRVYDIQFGLEYTFEYAPEAL
jgi:hypothetical protein